MRRTSGIAQSFSDTFFTAESATLQLRTAWSSHRRSGGTILPEAALSYGGLTFKLITSWATFDDSLNCPLTGIQTDKQTCFEARLTFLWGKGQDIRLWGTCGRHRAIPQPVWTDQEADCSGTLEKMGFAGTWYSGKERKPPVHQARGSKGPPRVQSSHLSEPIQQGARGNTQVFNGQLSQSETPNQRAESAPGVFETAM